LLARLAEKGADGFNYIFNGSIRSRSISDLRRIVIPPNVSIAQETLSSATYSRINRRVPLTLLLLPQRGEFGFQRDDMPDCAAVGRRA
jgi:hypothetical protein